RVSPSRGGDLRLQFILPLPEGESCRRRQGGAQTPNAGKDEPQRGERMFGCFAADALRICNHGLRSWLGSVAATWLIRVWSLLWIYLLFTIPAAAQTITTTSLPDAVVGVSYPAQALAATGGTTPYTWSVASGNLPLGLTLSTGGLISGTPAG